MYLYHIDRYIVWSLLVAAAASTIIIEPNTINIAAKYLPPRNVYFHQICMPGREHFTTVLKLCVLHLYTNICVYLHETTNNNTDHKTCKRFLLLYIRIQMAKVFLEYIWIFCDNLFKTSLSLNNKAINV